MASFIHPCLQLVHFEAVNKRNVLKLMQESHNWVMAFYRATGQAHKPAPPVTTAKTTTLTKNQGDADRARKHGKTKSYVYSLEIFVVMRLYF